MCTAWTMSKFVRWRVRDWVSCFVDCRFRLEDEPDAFHTPPDHQAQISNIVFGMKDENGVNRGSEKLTRQNGCRRERPMNNGSTKAVAIERKRGDSSWPSFQDEDYIVFCFGEDGAFDVVKDCTSLVLEEHSRRFDPPSTNPRPINRKLNYGEVVEIMRKDSQEKRCNAQGQDIFPTDEKIIVPVDEGKEEDAFGGRTRRDHIEENESSGTASTESTDSYQSESSKGSFSFPVLQWELVESPAQMPKSEATLHLRRHRVPCARFQCFKL